MILARMITGALKSQAIAARAIVIKMVTRAINDRRITGRRGRSQEAGDSKSIGEIAVQRGSPLMIFNQMI